LSESFILQKETTGCTSFTFVNSGVTEPKFTKFTNNVARSSRINFIKIRLAILQFVSECQGDELSWVYADLANFALKMVVMATSFKRSKKEGYILN